MTLNLNVMIGDIERAIRCIESEYRRNKGLILTESDLASLVYARLRHLFLSLSNRSGLRWHMPTQDISILASPLHLEVPWYDADGKLKIRPDITILDPAQLSILHQYGGRLRLPSKQFEFGGDAIILELKYIRHKSGVTTADLKAIESDFNKIQDNLVGQNANNRRGQLYCFFVVFNKTDTKCSEFDRYLVNHAQGDWYKYVYASGHVAFN